MGNHSKVLTRKGNGIRVFEDESSLEFLTAKNNASLFAVGSHSKHKPHRMVVGRTYEDRVLDMVEFEVTGFVSMDDTNPETRLPPLPAGVSPPRVGAKPLVLFQGEEWETVDVYMAVRSLLLELFLGDSSVDHLDLAGVESVVILSLLPGKSDGEVFIHVAHNKIILKKSGSRTPRVELAEVGPVFDLELRRTKFADAELMKDAMFVPQALRVKKKKNLSRDAFGSVVGAVHMERQDLTEVDTRKSKGLKKSKDKVLARLRAERDAELAAEEAQMNAGPSSKRQKGL